MYSNYFLKFFELFLVLLNPLKSSLLLAGENSMRGFLKSYHTAGIIIHIRLKGRPSRRDVSRGLSRTFKNPNQIFFKIQNRILST